MRNSFDFYYLMIPKLDWQTPPMILPEPLFDFSVCYNQKDLDLIYSSAVEPQRLTTINEITKIITENPDILVHLLNMDFCYNVVEHNPSLLTVFIRSAPDCTDLVMNAMHQHCLELSVLEISKSMAQDKLVGPEQVYILLEKMASACEMIHDREILDRKVRLVCLFAKSLLADNILQIDVVSVILDSFCLKFSRLKDAVELYRYLKQ